MRLGLINSTHKHVSADEQKQAIFNYAKKNNRSIEKFFYDDEFNLSLLKSISKKITLVVADVAVFGDGFESVLRTVQTFVNFGVSIYFIKEDFLVSEEAPLSFNSSADICLKIYKGLLSIRNAGVVVNIRQSGRKVGRPVGAKNRVSRIKNGASA